VKFGVQVELILDKACEVRTEDAGFVGWCSGSVVADSWVLSKGYADPYYLQDL